MADVSVKMGVSGVQEFKNQMAQAQATVKNVDAAMKLSEKQFKATGDAETYMQNKTQQLNQKLAAQQSAVKSAQSALQQMKANGVDPLSTSYQKMETALLNAQSAVLDTQSEINSLGTESSDAAGKTDKLAASLGGLNKTVSLETVISGIGRITGAMEKAAGMAVNLGKAIWENITDSASWADNVATQATILGMGVEDYQKLQSVFDTIADVTIADWTAARRKIRQAINEPSSDQVDVLTALGISTHESAGPGKFGEVQGVAKNWEDVFWAAAQELKRRVDSGEMTADLADTWGEALFGKKYSMLLPLIKLGEEAFNEAFDNETVVSEDAIEKLTELNDAYIKLQDDFRDLKAEVLASLAPALEGAANVLDTLLNRLMEYLKTPEGQQALKDLETAVSGLFEDLGKIDPEEVVSGFTGVFNTIIEKLQWLTTNWEDVVNALKWIVGGWAGLKLTGGALQMLQLVNGLITLKNGGMPNLPGTEGGGGTGTGSGGGWWTNLINGISGKAASIGTAGLQNLGLVYDWIMHGTPFGQMLTNGGSLQDAINAQLGSAKETGENIWGNMGDWWETTKGVYGNAIDFWKQFYGNIPELFKADQDYLDFEAELAARIRQDLGLDEPPAENGESVFDEYMKQRLANEASKLGTEDASGMLEGLIGIPTITVEPKPEDNAAEKIEQDVGVVYVPAELVFGDVPGQEGGGGSHGFANGLPWVPFDGYRAILHKGERVVPARAISNTRNYNSNLYVENMVMNNGQDAEGLAAKVAAAQRWTNRGYGG